MQQFRKLFDVHRRVFDPEFSDSPDEPDRKMNPASALISVQTMFGAMKRSWLFSLLFLSGISVSAQGLDRHFQRRQFARHRARQNATICWYAKQRRLNITRQTVTGYRVQIYFGSNRPKSFGSQDRFRPAAGRPGLPFYQQPNYKVRVGDFRSRLEAQQFLGKIEGQYPTMFIVPGRVRLPGLK